MNHHLKFVLFILLITSCMFTHGKATNILPYKITKKEKNNIEIFTYTYDSLDRINKIQIWEKNDGKKSTIKTILYIYDIANRISKVVRSSYADTDSIDLDRPSYRSESDYIYDQLSDTIVITINHYLACRNFKFLDEKEDMDEKKILKLIRDDDRLVCEMKEVNSWTTYSPITKYVYTYDQKNNIVDYILQLDNLQFSILGHNEYDNKNGIFKNVNFPLFFEIENVGIKLPLLSISNNIICTYINGIPYIYSHYRFDSNSYPSFINVKFVDKEDTEIFNSTFEIEYINS